MLSETWCEMGADRQRVAMQCNANASTTATEESQLNVQFKGPSRMLEKPLYFKSTWRSRRLAVEARTPWRADDFGSDPVVWGVCFAASAGFASGADSPREHDFVESAGGLSSVRAGRVRPEGGFLDLKGAGIQGHSRSSAAGTYSEQEVMLGVGFGR